MPNKEIVSAAEGDKIDWKEYLGKLLAVEPSGVEFMATKFSKGEKKECVRATVHVVLKKDGSEGETLNDVLIFPGVLVGQTKTKVGQIVVGRLGQGNATGDNNPPWKLAEANDAQISAVRSYLASRSVTSAAPAESAGDEWDDDATGDDEDSF